MTIMLRIKLQYSFFLQRYFNQSFKNRVREKPFTTQRSNLGTYSYCHDYIMERNIYAREIKQSQYLQIKTAVSQIIRILLYFRKMVATIENKGLKS